MRKTKIQKDINQMELIFQFKKSTQSDKPVQLVKPVKSTKAKRSNTGLSKESSRGKVKKRARGFQKLQGAFFENLIMVEELAVIFGLAPQTIRNWVAQGKLPRVKIGKRNLFLKRSVQEWLNRKEKSQWQ